IVTDGTTHRDAHECGAVGFRTLPRDIDAKLLRYRSAFVAAYSKPHISARNQGIEALCRQKITCNLFHGKLIESLVVIKRGNDIIPARQDIAAILIMPL